MDKTEFELIVNENTGSLTQMRAILTAAEKYYSSQNSSNALVRCCKDYYLGKLRLLDEALIHGSEKIAHDKAMDFHLRIAGTLELIRELEAL